MGVVPVCSSILRIKKSDCTPHPHYQQKANHCWVQKTGYYSSRLYKGSCPWWMTDADAEKDDKPICKPFPHIKLTTGMCSNKGGTQWNGWCLWNEGEYFKGRRLF